MDRGAGSLSQISGSDKPDAPPDASAPPTPSALPSATFATLPLEIKALVVAHVCANDVEHQEYRSRASKAEAALIKAVETPWHGRGVYAVAAVSKELNGICAKHMFESLSTKQASSLLLVRRILPKHVKYIHTIDLSGSLPLAKKAFDILPLLTNLSEIRISDSTAAKLFGTVWPLQDSAEEGDNGGDDSESGEEDSPVADQVIRRALFGPRTPTIRRIHVDNASSRRLRGMLGALTNLRSVSLGCGGGTAPFMSVRALVEALACAPLLRELTLELPKSAFITTPWCLQSTPWPALTSLALRGVTPTNETFDFVETFAATLESLDISFKPSTQPSANQLSSPLSLIPFPHLTQLRMVQLDLLTACIILESLQPPADTIPSALIKLDLELTRLPKPSSSGKCSEALRKVLVNLRSLSDLRVVESGTHRVLASLGRIRYPPSWKVSLGIPKDYFWDTSKAIEGKDADPARVAKRVAALRNTLEFGLAHIGTLEAEEDIAGLETTLEILKGLRVLQKVVVGSGSAEGKVSVCK
ncbi:hypothetical protein RQP46_008015 [Phenoliferia psychrophenolica]